MRLKKLIERNDIPFEVKTNLKDVINEIEILKRSKDELKGQNNLYQKIFNSFLQPIVVIDAKDYSIVLANKEAKNLYSN